MTLTVSYVFGQINNSKLDSVKMPVPFLSKEKFSRTNLYGEIGGAAIMSVNIEPVFKLAHGFYFATRTGVGLYISDIGLFGGGIEMAAAVPLSASVIFGSSFSFEAGYGVTLGLGNTEDAYGGTGAVKWYNAMLGFRYQNKNNGFLVRAAYTPMVRYSEYCYDPNCYNTERKAYSTPMFGVAMGARLAKRKQR